LANLACERVEERWYRRAGLLHVEWRVAARHHPAAGVKQVLAQRDCLARDIRLVRTAAVVTTDNAAIGRRPLRPVDPSVLESQLFGWVIAGR